VQKNNLHNINDEESLDIIKKYESLHDKIKNFLTKYNLPISWLAKKTNIAYSTLYKRLNNYTIPPHMMKNIQKVFASFDQDVSNIFK